MPARPRPRPSRGGLALGAAALVATALAVPATASDAPPTSSATVVADAGADLTVPESTLVQLDGSASSAATRTALQPSVRRGNLPGGTALGVELVDLRTDGSAPAARGALDLGQGPARRTTSIAYVVDVSASTEDPGQCGGDANRDGLIDTILDCEVAAALRLHEEVVASGTVDRVALIAFSSHAAARDLDPTAAEASLVAPDADADGDGVADVVQALRELRHGGGTNFVNSSRLACQVLAGAGSEKLTGVFLSDGIGTGDLRTVLPCTPAVTFQVFAAGAGSSCGYGAEWSRLQDLAALSGGSCRSVPRVADLPDLLPDVISSQLTGAHYRVDGGPAVDLAAGLGLPRTGPLRLDVDLPLPTDLSGGHEVCLTATGHDAAGSSSETTCSEVVGTAGTPTHAWQQVSGLPARLDGAATARPSYVAGDDGRQVFELTVSDDTGATATDRVGVDVTNVAPRLVVDRTTDDTGVTRLAGTVSDAGLLDTHAVTVRWGDGSTETLPAVSDTPGRGTFAVAHTYSGPGTYTIEVVAQDDDGGRDTVSVAGVEVRSPIAVWAHSASSVSSLDWTGGGSSSIWGRVHTNGLLRFTGSRKVVTGPTTYAGPLAADTTRHSFAPAPMPVAVRPYPFRPDLAAYRPGGEVAREVGAAYRDMSSRCSAGAWSPSSAPLAAGVYYASCDIQVNGADLAGKVTLVSEGRVKVFGSRPQFEPFARGYLAIAGAAGKRAIDVSASSSGFSGILFAERGEVSLSGNGNAFRCGVLGDQVSVTGSDVEIRAGGCGPA